MKQLKNNKIKKQTIVKIKSDFWSSSYNDYKRDVKDYKELVTVERPTSNNPSLKYREGGSFGLADCILIIEGDYDFDKHGFTIGGSNGTCEKVRVVIPHSFLEII